MKFSCSSIFGDLLMQTGFYVLVLSAVLAVNHESTVFADSETAVCSGRCIWTASSSFCGDKGDEPCESGASCVCPSTTNENNCKCPGT